MNPSEKNKLYDKYLAGVISQDEMHRLNQYALDDDFLFDALEGAASFEDGNAAAIEDLETRFASKKKKVRPLYFWLSAVAGVTIIVFALTFIQAPKQEVMSDVVLQQEDLKQEDALFNEEVAVIEASEDDEHAGKIDLEDAKAGKDKDFANKETDESQPATTESDGPITIEYEDSNRQHSPPAAPPAPIPAPQTIETLQSVEVAQTKVIPPVKNELTEMTRERDDLQPVAAGASESESKEKPVSPVLGRELNKASAFTPAKNTSEGKARKRSQEQAPVADEKLFDGEEAVSFDEFTDFFEVVILDDPANTLKLQKHAFDALEIGADSGEFVATFSIKGGVLESGIKIIKSMNGKLDEQLVNLIETFEGWEGSGNKTVRFLFK